MVARRIYDPEVENTIPAFFNTFSRCSMFVVLASYTQGAGYAPCDACDVSRNLFPFFFEFNVR